MEEKKQEKEEKKAEYMVITEMDGGEGMQDGDDNKRNGSWSRVYVQSLKFILIWHATISEGGEKIPLIQVCMITERHTQSMLGCQKRW